MKKWTLNSWKNYPVKHIPEYENNEILLIKKFKSLSSPFTLITQASLNNDLLIFFAISKPSIVFENGIFLPSGNFISGMY